MLRLTLRTLLAYLDDTLSPADARQMGQKAAENPNAQELIARIRRVTRRRGLSTPPTGPDGGPSDPNTVAEYLSDALSDERLTAFEQACLDSDVHLAEVAACHQILTMVLSEPLRVPPTARKRMYQLVKGRESVPDRKPGQAVPVGGVSQEDHSPEAADDVDAPLFLGLSDHPKSHASRPTRGLIGTALGLALALGVAVWMALPAVLTPPSFVPSDGEIALAPPPRPVVEATPEPSEGAAPAEKTSDPPDAKPDTEPAPKAAPDASVEPQSKPDNQQAEPKPEPAGELVPAPEPPRQDKMPIGRLDRPSNVVVLLRSADESGWKRAVGIDPVIPTAQPVLSLPGYRSNVRLDSGIQVDLWGNLPDLFPSPLLGSEVTFHVPPAGFDADLTVNAGRIYLTAKKPSGGKVRLRFVDQIWDVTLPDEKADVAFELVRARARGTGTEQPRVDTVLAVLAGTAGLKVRYKDIPKIEPGEVVTWDNKGKGLDGPRKPDPASGGKPPVYFSRFPLATESEQHRRMNAAVEELSRRLSDPDRVRVVLAEMHQGRSDPSGAASARVAVFAEAAMRDWTGLVSAISDASRPFVRDAAAIGLQAALAADQDGAAECRKLLIERYRLTPDQADTAIRLLRGFTEAEKKRPETLDLLVDALASPAVAVRELAFMNLLTDVDTESVSNPALTRYDAGGSDEAREAAIRAWRRRAEEVKKKLEAME